MFASRFPNIERRDSGPAHRDATADPEVGYEAAYVPPPAPAQRPLVGSSASIYKAVLAVMQEAEEMDGPDPVQYARLMEAIADEAMARQATALRNHREAVAEKMKAARVAPKVAMQDGPDFYDAATEELLCSYPDDVKGDFDMPGAAKARERFLRHFPAYRMEDAS